MTLLASIRQIALVEHLEKIELEPLAEIVHEEHCLRLDVKFDEPLVPRPFKPRPRPKTAIISAAAQRKIEARTLLANAINHWKR